MINVLHGLKVAILITSGFQQVEMTSPRQVLEDAGATVHLVSDVAIIQAWDCDIPKVIGTFKADVLLADAYADEYDALIIPGGYASPEELRLNPKAIAFIKGFAHKPIAAICHGPNILIDAELVKNKKLTSYPAIKQDLLHAGAVWVNQSAVRDGNLVTSRSPEDLEFFNKAILELFVEYYCNKRGLS